MVVSVVSTVWTVLCTAGIAFCVRFLVALCQKSKLGLTGYWARLRIRSGKDKLAHPQARTRPVTRAA
jgi:hypothetical protein